MDSYASITGDLALYDKRGKICQWIEDIDALDSNINSRNPAHVSDEYPATANGARPVENDILKGPDGEAISLRLAPPESVLGEREDDLDDDFFAEAAQQALAKGKTSFAAADYANASAYLKEGLTMSKELSKRPQALQDTWELRRMLGVCAFHVDSPPEAEDALLSVLANAPKNAILSETQRLHVSETAHLLAQVDVKLGKLDQAYRYCEYCLRGRRRVLGKNHAASYESLALMAKILQLQNNGIRAEFFVGMIPEPERNTFTKKYEDLSVPKVPPAKNKLEEDSAIQKVPVTPPASPPIRSISEVFKAPAIPERSPSRGGTPPRRGESGPPSVSAASLLSARYSTISGQVSAPASEADDTATQTSLSPPGSPQLTRLSPTSVPRPDKSATAFFADASSAQNPHLLPAQYSQSLPDRPDHRRTVSGKSGHSPLPSISEPGLPDEQHSNEAANGLPNGSAASKSTAHAGEPQQQQQKPPGELLPKPLRPQQRQFISELPGDTAFSVSDGPGSDTASMRMGEKDLKPQITRDSAFTVSSLRRSPNIALPEQEDPSHNEIAQPTQPVQPAQPLQSIQPPQDSTQSSTSLVIQPDHDPQRASAQQYRVFPPVQQNDDTERAPKHPYHRYSPPPEGTVFPHSMERTSFSSSVWSDASNSYSTPYFRSAIETKIVPMQHTQSAPFQKESKRKASLLKVFRSNTNKESSSSFNSFHIPTSEANNYKRNASINYNGVRLTKRDTDSIKNDWLTDAAIDFWQEYLEHEMLQHSPKFALLRPMRTALLVREPDNPTSMKAALPDFAASPELMHVFIPITAPSRTSAANGGHISLLLLSPRDGMACHYDPLAGKNNNRNLASQLATHISQHIDLPLTFLDVPDTPQQLQEKDCGVFVCFFMQHLITKLQTTKIGQKVDASMVCKTIEAKNGRKIILKAVEARRKAKEGGTLFEE